MTTKPTRRKANIAEREAAAELVRRFRESNQFVERAVDRNFQFGDDGHWLADALERFSREGTFLPSQDFERSERDLNLLRDYSRLRLKGLAQEEAIGRIAEHHRVSDQKVRDVIYGRKRRPE